MGSIGIFSVMLSIFIFNLILYWLSLLYSFFFSKTGKNLMHRDFYECGFRSIVDNKIILDIHFTIIGILFLIIEMEIILFTPVLLNSYSISFFFFIIIFVSLFILSISFFYEWERYGLNWIL